MNLLKMSELVCAMLTAGTPGVLCVLMGTRGSVPGALGSCMLVTEAGSAGTIGGGVLEYRAANSARDMLSRNEAPRRERFSLDNSAAGALGMICGGECDVLFLPLSPGDAALQVFSRACGASGGAWIVLSAEGDEIAAADDTGVLCGALSGSLPPEAFGDRARLERTGGREYLVLPVKDAGVAYVFGAGHVGGALAPLLAELDFSVCVCDDRAELLERFAAPVRTVACDFARLDEIALKPNDYAIIMTRGHEWDYDALVWALRRAPRYVGLMGSARKMALTRERLLRDGFSEETIAGIRNPIGLKIGARTPTEIAVSVAAELIAERAGLL
ncbi:MAG: XdhC family protein [Clostridia bacterium]|nr:XdhC family protein [Clostridia bacterium]